MQYIETQGPRKNTALTQTLWQLAYEATRTKLAAKPPVLWSSLTKRWLHQELNATGHAGQLGASVIAFFGPFGFFRRGPDSDMALDSHGFVWHLLTFYISNLTSEASLWHSMLCPFTASVARGLLLTFSYIFLLLRIIFQLGRSWTLMNFHHFVNLVWKRHCATRPSQLDPAAMI